MITPTKSRSSRYLEGFETTGYGSNADSGGGSLDQSGGGSQSWMYGSPSDIKKKKYGMTGGTSRGGSSGSGSRQSSTKTIRKGAAPELPDMPTYEAPEINKRAMKAATQKLAAPGKRMLRETVQQAMGKNFENPNVRKMTLREALQGYGTGLEKVMSGAGREARSNQMAELDLQREQEMANFQQQTKTAMQSYQNAWSDYLKGEETVTTSGPATEEAGGYGGKKMGNKTYYQTRDPFSGNVRPI